MALKSGRRPVTGGWLPAPSSSSALGSGTYALLKPKPSGDCNFVPYVPTVDKVASPSGISAARKRMLLTGRLLYKLGREAAVVRRRRRKEVKTEVRELIRTFLGDEDDGGQQQAAVQTIVMDDQGQKEPVEPGACSDEEFWAKLPVVSSRERHMLNVPTKPSRIYPGRTIKSRSIACDASGGAP